MYKIIFHQTPSLLIIFLPFFLISGPFLSDLAVSICSLMILLNYFIYQDLKRYFHNKFVIIYLIFCIFLIWNSIFISDHIIFSLKNSLFYFRFGLFSLCVWYLLNINESLLKYFFISLVFAFTILIIDGYIQYFFGSNIFGWKLYPGPRISSLFGDELIYGSYLSRILPIMFGLMIINIEKNYINNSYKYLIFILFVLTDVAVFLSGERTAFFLINFGALLFILGSKNYKLSRLFIFLISTLFIIILSFSETKSKYRIFDQTFKEMNIFQKSNDDQLSKRYFFSKTHHEHYISALKMFNDQPFFGIGHKNFRYKCSEKKFLVSQNSCASHPHNYYIQFLSELGIVAFLFLIFIFFRISFLFSKNIIANLFKNKSYLLNDFQVCLFIAILLTLWPIIPSGNFFNNWISIIIFLPVGFLLWSFDKNK